MSAAVAIALAVVAILVGVAIGFWLPPHGRLPTRNRARPVRRILLPFTGHAISRRAFEAAIRLARAENAVDRVMPVVLQELQGTKQRAVESGVARGHDAKGHALLFISQSA